MQNDDELLEAAKLAKNILFLLEEEVNDLGLSASMIIQKLNHAIINAERERREDKTVIRP